MEEQDIIHCFLESHSDKIPTILLDEKTAMIFEYYSTVYISTLGIKFFKMGNSWYMIEQK